MNVDLPTPGTPVIPTRMADRRRAGAVASSSCRAQCPMVGRGGLDERDRAAPRGARSPADAPRDVAPRRRRLAASGRRRARSRSDLQAAARRSPCPGGKIAAAPASRKPSEVLGRDHPADHDQDVGAAEPGQRLPAPDQGEVAGRQRRSPRRRARRPRPPGGATSSGVANNGPTSTSKPRSANAVAITFWPRSCPSWPILATRMRGRRPSLAGERVGGCPDLLDRRSVSPGRLRYTPEIVRIAARVTAEDLLEGVGDLPHRGPGPGRVDGQRQQVLVQRLAAGARQRSPGPRSVSASSAAAHRAVRRARPAGVPASRSAPPAPPSCRP